MKKQIKWIMAGALLAGLLHGADRSWTGGGNGRDWFDAANWTPSDKYPQDGDNVTVAGTSTLLLTNNTAALGSLAITNATMTVSNWTTRINADAFYLRNKGTITLPGAFQNSQMSNRVHIVADNVVIDKGGKIDVDGKGYMVSNGPGCPGAAGGSPEASGAGYGGRGADENRYPGGSEIGTAAQPFFPGSGGRRYTGSGYPTTAGCGGGAVRIEADSVTVDGIITAKGTVGLEYDGGGSGGGIWITALQFGGIGGEIVADGANAGYAYGGGGGGGGRIAVTYDEIAGDCTVSYSATPGALFTTEAAGMGTLYLPDTQLITAERLGKYFHNVRLVVPGWSEWRVDSLTLNGKAVCLGEEGFKLTVTNNLVVQSNGWLAVGCKALSSRMSMGFTNANNEAKVTVGGNVIVRGGTLTVGGFDQKGPTWIDVSGDFVLTNTPSYSGCLYVGPGPTNAVALTNGAVVTVAGDFTIATNAWYYPLALPKAAGTVRLSCRNLTIQNGGGINADAAGYYSYSDAAYGPGAGTSGGSRGGGGGHGGRGGNGAAGISSAGGVTNDLVLTPLLAGSAGGFGHSPQPGYSIGGGYVRLETGMAIVDGTITANGSNADTYGGGGAGGGVFIMCDTFAGGATASLRANGGNGGSVGGGGGGGRIAVAVGLSPEKRAMLLAGAEIDDLYVYDSHSPFQGVLSVNGGTGSVSGDSGSALFMAALEGTVTLEVRGDYAELGAPYPYLYGMTIGLQRDIMVTNFVATPVSISSGVRGACIGWRVADIDGALKGQGGSTNAVFQMTEDLIQTWYWTNEYELVVNIGPGGSVNSGAANGWYTDGSESVALVATPDSGYAFHRWIGDVDDSQRKQNPLTLVMAGPRTVQAEFYSLSGGIKRWRGNGAWEEYGKWEPSGAPGPFDDVFVINGNLQVSLPCDTRSFVISNSATLTASNWNAPIVASNEFRVCSGATVTLPPPFVYNGGTSNRVWIKCGDFVAEPNSTIDIALKGYFTHTGPGKGYGTSSPDGSGGGYGGKGGNSSSQAGGVAYGVTNAPFWPGSGGGGGYDNAGGHGGGAVWIDVANSVVVDGKIDAGGGNGDSYNGGGAGGSIFIIAHTFRGAETGKLLAKGGNRGWSYPSLGGGGGGRIAVWTWNTAPEMREALMAGARIPGLEVAETHPDFAGEVSVDGGTGYQDGERGTVVFIKIPYKMGTMIMLR